MRRKIGGAAVVVLLLLALLPDYVEAQYGGVVRRTTRRRTAVVVGTSVVVAGATVVGVTLGVLSVAMFIQRPRPTTSASSTRPPITNIDGALRCSYLRFGCWTGRCVLGGVRSAARTAAPAGRPGRTGALPDDGGTGR